MQFICPEPSCGAQSELPGAQDGGVAICPHCHEESTALSDPIWQRLRRREAKHPGWRGELTRWVVVANHVRSEWNIGSLFRSAEAAGWDHLILAGISAVPPSPGITKTALGAESYLPWSYYANVLPWLDGARAAGARLVALERITDAKSIFDYRVPQAPLVLILGNERSGVPPEVLRRCHEVLEIPMQGRKESLNLAVAFGVAAFQLQSSTCQSR